MRCFWKTIGIHTYVVKTIYGICLSFVYFNFLHHCGMSSWDDRREKETRSLVRHTATRGLQSFKGDAGIVSAALTWRRNATLWNTFTLTHLGVFNSEVFLNEAHEAEATSGTSASEWRAWAGKSIPEGLGHRDNTPICFKRYLPRDGSGKLIPNLINGNNNFHLRLSSVSAGRVHSEYNK